MYELKNQIKQFVNGSNRSLDAADDIVGLIFELELDDRPEYAQVCEALCQYEPGNNKYLEQEVLPKLKQLASA